MKYKVNDTIIEAKNELEAVKKYKDSDIEYLTQEEEKAVDDYRKAIQNTSNPKLLKLYQHILNEELEHIDELTSAEVVEDACKTRDAKFYRFKYEDKNGVIKFYSSDSDNFEIAKNELKEWATSKNHNPIKIISHKQEFDSCKTNDDLDIKTKLIILKGMAQGNKELIHAIDEIIKSL